MGLAAGSELQGRVTSVAHMDRQDAEGNVHVIEQETVNDNGTIVHIDVETVENREGELLSS